MHLRRNRHRFSDTTGAHSSCVHCLIPLSSCGCWCWCRDDGGLQVPGTSRSKSSALSCARRSATTRKSAKCAICSASSTKKSAAKSTPTNSGPLLRPNIPRRFAFYTLSLSLCSSHFEILWNPSPVIVFSLWQLNVAIKALRCHG